MPVDKLRISTIVKINIVIQISFAAAVTDRHAILLTFDINAGHTDARINIFGQPNTEIDSETIYTDPGSNPEIQCLGSGCKQQDYAD